MHSSTTVPDVRLGALCAVVCACVRHDAVAVANRIVTVGDPKRAVMLCSLLDPGYAVHTVASTRGFTVYTGTFHQVRVARLHTHCGKRTHTYTHTRVQAHTQYSRDRCTGAGQHCRDGHGTRARLPGTSAG
jgi:hypothetical protein